MQPTTSALRVVVLLSGSGTLFQAVLDAMATGALTGVDVVAVGSDRSSATGLQRAQSAGIDTFVHRLSPGQPRRQWDQELSDLVASYRPDLVVSAGFMKLVGEDFLARFGGRMINTHPSLLPAFPGAHAVADALAHNVKVTGCTVFVVDAGVDTGPILAQQAVPVRDGDDEQTLHERIKVAERELLVDTLNAIASKGRV